MKRPNERTYSTVQYLYVRKLTYGTVRTTKLQLHFQLFSIAVVVVVVVNFLPWHRSSIKMQSYDKQMQWRRAAQLKVRETEKF